MAEVETSEIGAAPMLWHAVTLDFIGPPSAENATINPFTDYRLDVTFTHAESGQTRVIPGFFAADGDAATTGATAGDTWRTIFAPDLEGAWTWKASFRTGADVAAEARIKSGQSAGYADGATGRLDIVATDKDGRDLRGKGTLQPDDAHYFRFAGSGEAWLKSGANGPENLLAYEGFDATVPSHAFAPHIGDWRPGDPLWADGQGKGLIGAINYLADTGVNALYMLTMNQGGDGNDVSPWIAGSTDRYDVSKLAQWSVLFDHMTTQGVVAHLVTQEQENDQLLDGGALGVDRAVYYRELVARFGHQPGVLWNLGEENTNSDFELRAFAKRIEKLDAYDHPILVHSFKTRQDATFGPQLGRALDGVSLQTLDTHALTIEWIDRSAAAGRPWAVTHDEIAAAGAGVPTDADDPGHDAIRADHLWGNLMAGGAGVEWYFGNREQGDLTLEDFRTRDEMFRQTGIALQFFEAHLPFERMVHADELTPQNDYVFALPGVVYAVYLPKGGVVQLDLDGAPGAFNVRWFDPLVGGALRTGSVTEITGGGVVDLGAPPTDVDPSGKDWVVLVAAPGYEALL